MGPGLSYLGAGNCNLDDGLWNVRWWSITLARITAALAQVDHSEPPPSPPGVRLRGR